MIQACLLLALVMPASSEAAVARFQRPVRGWSAALRPLQARLPWLTPAAYPALVTHLDVSLDDFKSSPELMAERLERARAGFRLAAQPKAIAFMLEFLAGEAAGDPEPKGRAALEYLARYHAPLLEPAVARLVLDTHAAVASGRAREWEARSAAAKDAVKRFAADQGQGSTKMESMPALPVNPAPKGARLKPKAEIDIEKAVDTVFSLLKRSEKMDYIGESISQLEHALQTAAFAQKAGGDEELVLAALMHDVGHFAFPDVEQMNGFGAKDHDKLGGQYVRGLGFSRRVADLIAGHVQAKRYLSVKKKGYLKRLSSASMETLKFQGGPMTAAEMAAFEKDPLFKDKLRMRSWDEMAKLTDWKAPGLDEYRSMMLAHLRAQKGGPLKAVIDMGSNHFKLMIARVVNGDYDEPYIEKKELGAGDDLSKHGKFSRKKLAEMREALAYFKQTAVKKWNLIPSLIATAAFRESPNKDEVIEMAKELGMAIEIASERRESELAYMSATMGAPRKAVIDLGSRTIEVVVKNKKGYDWRVYKLGYRISFEKYFAKAKTFAEAAKAYRSDLERLVPEMEHMKGQTELLGIEFSEMAKFMQDPGKPIHGMKLTASKIRAEIARLSKLNAKQFAKLRADEDIDEVLPRLVFLDHMFKLTGYDSITIMDRELGAGLIAEAARI